MDLSFLHEELKEKTDSGKLMFKENLKASAFTSFRTGGNCPLVLFPLDEETLIELIKALCNRKIRFNVIGNASNILIRDEGYDGALIITTGMNRIEFNGENAWAYSGASLTALSVAALKEGLSGLEFAYGIPGSVGGAVYMNAGAYDSQMKNVVVKTRYISRKGEMGVISGEEHLFEYRKSFFTDNDNIIIFSQFSLERANEQDIKAKMDDFMERRRSKQPLEYPSAGSVFKRYEGRYIGKMIEDAGLKGKRIGGAMISQKHAGFIINYENASTSDVLELIEFVTCAIKNTYGITLEREVRIIE